MGLPLAWLLLWRARAEELLAAPVRRPRGNLTRTVRKGGAVINYFARKPKAPLTAAERLRLRISDLRSKSRFQTGERNRNRDFD